MVKYLGSICAQYVIGGRGGDGDLAFVFGLLGTAALGWAAGSLVWRDRARFRVLLPYFALSAYSIGTALMTGVGRVGFGSDQALANRYCTTVAPLWVSLIVFLLLLALRGHPPAEAGSGQKQQRGGPEDYRTVAAASLLLGAIGLLALSSICATEGVGYMSWVQEYWPDAVAGPGRAPGGRDRL